MPKSNNNVLRRLEQCTTEHDKRIFSFNDPGTNNRFTVKTKGRRCRKIQIEGALTEIQPNKCDWCLWDYDNNVFVFFELKGSDLKHAAKQLGCTISWFKANVCPFSIYRETYVIVRQSSSIPSMKTEAQTIRAAFLKKYKSFLQPKHSGGQLSF